MRHLELNETPDGFGSPRPSLGTMLATIYRDPETGQALARLSVGAFDFVLTTAVNKAAAADAVREFLREIRFTGPVYWKASLHGAVRTSLRSEDVQR